MKNGGNLGVFKKLITSVSKGFMAMPKATIITVSSIAVCGVATVGVCTGIQLSKKNNDIGTAGTISQISSQVESNSIIVSNTSSSELISSEETSSEETSSEAISSQAESIKPVSSTSSSSKPTTSQATTSSKQTSSKVQSEVDMTGVPEGYSTEFAKWYKQNPEIKAHLEIPGTNVNYPVCQTKNNTFYLDHNEFKKHYAWGIPYLDFRVSISKKGNSKNIMMYGHGDDKRGLMLSNMKKYRDVNFYKQHPVINFNTPYEEAQWKVITMFIENTSPDRGDKVFHFWDYIDDTSEEGFNDFIAKAKERAFFTSTVDVNSSDKLLTIQVCEDTNINNYNRLVLVARKLREGESADVDVSGAVSKK